MPKDEELLGPSLVSAGGPVTEPNPRGFGAVAIHLAKNPLGIIALFIVLVYAIGGLVVSTSRPGTTEALIGMAFIATFPVLVLGVFYVLVAHHHMKLYDPSQIVQSEKFIDAWIDQGKFIDAVTPDVEADNKGVIARFEQSIGAPATESKKIKAAMYVGEWTQRRMSADRAIFRQVRKQGVEGFTRAILDSKQNDAISRVFDFLEELSSDVIQGKVDVDIIRSAMGPSLRRAWERSRDFILLQR